jgi:hypothetical protein
MENSRSLARRDWINIKVAPTCANSYCIKSIVIVVTTSYIRVVIIGAHTNKSPNECTIINRGIRKTTTDFVYNK